MTALLWKSMVRICVGSKAAELEATVDTHFSEIMITAQLGPLTQGKSGFDVIFW